MRFAYKPIRVTAPAEKPVSVEEAMLYCRVDDPDQSPMIDRFVGAATEHLDGYSGTLGRCIVTQVWSLTFDRFCKILRLPFPASEIVSIKHVDASDVEQTVAASVYALRHDALGSYVELKSDQSWPAIADRREAVKITFKAGFGAAEAVPEGIKTAILMIVREVYDAGKSDTESAPRIALSGVMKWFLSDYALKAL